MTNASNDAALELEATHLALREIGPWLRRQLELAGHIDHPKLGVVELAVHELATNSVDHAASPDGRLRLVASVVEKLLTVELIDHGRSFELESIEHPTEPQVRGYGMMIIEQVTEQLCYEHVDETNRWSASFAL